MPRRLAGFVAALLGGAALVDAQHGPYKYCCDLQKCHNVTATCAQIPACAADCLGAGNGSAVTGISDTCSPPAALPGLDYACFAAHLSGRAPAAPSLIGQVCGQAYAPGRQPAPDAWIRFGDCRATCPGWDLPLPASSLASTGPVVMLMQYIVPVAVFCLTVPRRRRWAAPDWMFASPHETANTPVQLLLLWPARLAAVLVLAALVVTFDLVVWIFTTFAAAGPILVGGITELVLDVAVLRHMEESPDDNSSNSNNRKRIDDEKPLTADERVELTVVVLCGNLDDSVGSPREKITVLLKEQQQQPQQQQPAREGSVPDNAAPNTPATTPATQARLAALLRAQGTFGSLVGAPVLFFVGSFVVALTGLSEHIGDNGTALSLAFGMWWMVLVQVTVVSSCTLASNNPSTVQGIVGAYSATERHPVYLVRRLAMTSVYDSVFMPVTLWDRGRMKTRWLRRTDAWERHAWLQRRLTIGPLTALVLIPLAAFALVLVPTALAFLVSYTTPKICVSCRSMTFLVYLGSQVVLIEANAWRTYCADDDRPVPGRGAASASASADHTAPRPATPLLVWLRQLPNAVRALPAHARPLLHRAAADAPAAAVGVAVAAAVLAAALAVVGAISAAFAGTVLQLLGVYGNCVCSIPASTWLAPRAARDAVLINLATDTLLHRQMSVYWSAAGYAAIGFTCATTYAGWWYQRSLRHRLEGEIQRLGEGGL